MSGTAQSRQALVGAGSNLGDRWQMLCRAAAALRAAPGMGRVDASPVFSTAPVGVGEQPEFLNLVFGVETRMTPEELLDLLMEIERQAGRVRTVRWGPRPLDLDLLAYEGETRTGPALELPHPRMLERPFVTVPLRAVLALPRYRIAAWDELRRQLAGRPTGPGVDPWQTGRPA